MPVLRTIFCSRLIHFDALASIYSSRMACGIKSEYTTVCVHVNVNYLISVSAVLLQQTLLWVIGASGR